MHAVQCDKLSIYYLLQVFERLYEQLGDLYTEENVMLASTHTHSAPGGFHTYWMYQAATGGFINETFDALVNGIALVSACVRVSSSSWHHAQLWAPRMGMGGINKRWKMADFTLNNC